MGVGRFFLLSIGIIISIFLLLQLILTMIRSVSDYINQENTIDTKNRQEKGYQPDFIDYTVHYEAQRLGEKRKNLFGNRRKKGRFIIDAKRITVGDFAFGSDDIYWFNYSPTDYKITFDLNVDSWWYRLTIDPGYGGKEFIEAILGVVPDYLQAHKNTALENIRTVSLVPATINYVNIDGTYNIADSVELALTPIWLLVLQHERVIDMIALNNIQDLEIRDHPNVLDNDTQLITFDEDKPYAFAFTDKTFATSLVSVTQQNNNSMYHQKSRMLGNQ